jgi:hypothetical protein
MSKPHYRLRLRPLPESQQWQVQNVDGYRRDYIVYATSWYRVSGLAVNAAREMPLPR